MFEIMPHLSCTFIRSHMEAQLQLKERFVDGETQALLWRILVLMCKSKWHRRESTSTCIEDYVSTAVQSLNTVHCLIVS